MKTRCSNLIRSLSVPLLVTGAIVSQAFSQAQPRLGVQWSEGKITLSLSGAAGTVYSIQYATSLSPASHWVDRTLLQAQDTGNVWLDPAASDAGQRFYRAVSVPAPADPNLVFIQPGTFLMGSPANEAERNSDEIQHPVRISRGFWMEKYLVTQGDYLGVMGTNSSYFVFNDDLTLPADAVHWADATNYCALLTQRERANGRIPINYTYRLPTEAEWEYACRAGTTTAFYLGDSLVADQANFYAIYEYHGVLGTVTNLDASFVNATTPVGSYEPNAWGLYDMIGNVVEWCHDWYGGYPAQSLIDPQGAGFGVGHVYRGGAWGNPATQCRSASRGVSGAGVVFPGGWGFRVVLAQGP